MDSSNADQDELSREITRALESVDEGDRTLFLAKLALKLGHQLGDPKEVSQAIDEARRDIDG
jgi:hypothetical protein